MIYVTGDTHAERMHFLNYRIDPSWTADDIHIVCGDWGFLLRDNEVETQFLDLLEQLPETRTGYDVDVLLLYDDPADAAREVAKLTAAGKTVSAQRDENSPIRYRERLDLRKEAGVC